MATARRLSLATRTLEPTVSDIDLELPASQPTGDPVADLAMVVLVGFSSGEAGRLAAPIRAVAPGVTFRAARRSALEKARSSPAGTVLILRDRLADGSGAELLRGLRDRGVETPAILLLHGAPPADLWTLGAVDAIPLAEFSELAFHRSLVLFESAVARQRLLAEASRRLRAYEQVLESKDEDRQWVLQVASTLKRRLAAAEQELEQAEAAWNERLERSQARNQRLEERLAELTGASPSERRAGDGPRILELETALADSRQECRQQEEMIAELHRTVADLDGELREDLALPTGDLPARLEASEQVRSAQTEEILNSRRRIAELEQHLETIATLLHAEPGNAPRDPAEMLQQVATRLTNFERIREAQQGTIDKLSHSLAMRQVDDALDDAQARRNVVRRVEESVRRAQRFRSPLICLLLGIDHPESLRASYGSVSYDFMLVQIAQKLRFTLRQNDVLMRYGTEGFLLIPDAKTLVEARGLGERLVKRICSEPVELGAQRLQPSFSVAILSYREEMNGANELIRRARELLSAAQSEGERQVTVDV